MRHLIVSLCLLLACGTLCAQKGAPEAVLKDIRARYAEAMSMAQHQRTSEGLEGKNYMTSTLHYVIPGCGPTTETLSMYYLLEESEESGEPCYTPYLITRKYNIAARQFYEEYLYDHATAQPLFVFLKYDTYEAEGAVAEERYYFADGQVVWKTMNDYAQPDEASVSRMCSTLRSAFAYLINHSF